MATVTLPLTYPITVGEWSVTTAPSVTAKENSMKDLWQRVKRKENWESRMPPGYFWLVILGSVISAVGIGLGVL
jgi:hypothetical protein